MLCVIALSFLVDQGEAVSQGDDDLLDAGVFFHAVVKGEDTTGLCLALCLGIHYLAGPQGVVGDDKASIIQVFHHEVIVLDILAFVGVDEDEVVTFAQCGNDVTGVADV